MNAQAGLDAAIAEVHEKGEPILFEDFDQPALMDDENGLVPVMAALDNWPNVADGVYVRVTDSDWYIEGPEAGFTDPVPDNAAYLASCEEVFELLRQAGEMENASRNLILARPLYDLPYSNLGNQRELARLVEDASRRALESGDTALFFETTHHLYTIARHTDQQMPVLIDSLVAISIMALNRDLIERSLPKIDPADLRDGEARELAEQTIAQLTDGMLREVALQSWIGERAWTYDVIECVLDGTVDASDVLYDDGPLTFIMETPGLSYMYRPALKKEQRYAIDINTQIIEGLKRDEPLAYYQSVNQAFEQAIIDSKWSYPFTSVLMPAYGAAMRTYFRSEALLRCTAVALAIKLYQADHGKRPDTLDALVPDYLTAVPVDPFSPTGEPIQYNPIGVVPTLSDTYSLTDEQIEHLEQHAIRRYPLVYSVGHDGTDENGGPLFVNRYGTLDDGERFQQSGNAGDIWFVLDAWPERVYTDSDLGIQDPFGFDEDWYEGEEDESETDDGEVEVGPAEGQDAEDQDAEQ